MPCKMSFICLYYCFFTHNIVLTRLHNKNRSRVGLQVSSKQKYARWITYADENAQSVMKQKVIGQRDLAGFPPTLCVIQIHFHTFLTYEAGQGVIRKCLTRSGPVGKRRHMWTRGTRPASNPAKQPGTRFTYLRGMEGWADLSLVVGYIPRWLTCLLTVTHPCSNHLIATRPVEPTTSLSWVQRPNGYATKPPVV